MDRVAQVAGRLPELIVSAPTRRVRAFRHDEIDEALRERREVRFAGDLVSTLCPQHQSKRRIAMHTGQRILPLS